MQRGGVSAWGWTLTLSLILPNSTHLFSHSAATEEPRKLQTLAVPLRPSVSGGPTAGLWNSTIIGRSDECDLRNSSEKGYANGGRVSTLRVVLAGNAVGDHWSGRRWSGYGRGC
jgi:hypothetical protein